MSAASAATVSMPCPVPEHTPALTVIYRLVMRQPGHFFGMVHVPGSIALNMTRSKRRVLVLNAEC